MKAYTFRMGELVAGIRVSLDDLGEHVFLGEEGEGRRYERVRLDRKDPPDLYGDGNEAVFLGAVLHTITINWGTPKERVFTVLQKTPSCDRQPGALVRVNTCWMPIRKSWGQLRHLRGNPKIVFLGKGARGEDGTEGGWEDGLVEMRPRDVLKVVPEGGDRVQSYVLACDQHGEVQCMTYKDFKAGVTPAGRPQKALVGV